jgi:hypothetical protein
MAQYGGLIVSVILDARRGGELKLKYHQGDYLRCHGILLMVAECHLIPQSEN